MICTVRGEGDITIHIVQSVGQYDICTVNGGGGGGILPSIMYSL